MKYYVVADVHGFYTKMREALEKAGFFSDPEPHKLIMLGDVMDRGGEAAEMQDFILRHMEIGNIVLVRGNHDDLFEALATKDGGRHLRHHVHNRTFDTGLQLTGLNAVQAWDDPSGFARAMRETPYYTRILPAMVNYYETEHCVFVHGWLPLVQDDSGNLSYTSDWRNAGEDAWRDARWYNGMRMLQISHESKTVYCGHFHASYGHSALEHRGHEFGPDADFTPYVAPGIVALDACTAVSGFVNVVCVED